MSEKNSKNKDYIINLRVSRETYDKIKQKAGENKETISHLLRKVIDDSSEIFHDLSEDIFGKKDFAKEIVSYHKAKLASEVKCDNCHKSLGKNTMVTVGETKSGKKYYFCSDCLK